MDSQDAQHRPFRRMLGRRYPQPPHFHGSIMGAPPPPPPPPPPQPISFAVPDSNDMMLLQQGQEQGNEENRVFPLNSVVGAGGPPNGSDGSASGFGVEPPAKKKRGRPRKYSPDGNIALGLSAAPVAPVSQVVGHPDSAAAPPSENQPKKIRGRPPGSVKKQLDVFGSAGFGFTPHVIAVLPGEDIAQKIMAFSQQGSRTVCVLSANGTVSNVTLRQPATCGGTLTLEGLFEILSLSGSFLLSESDSNGSRSRSGGLSVSLASGDGQVVGGGVSGMLRAASPVQVVVGSFIGDARKPPKRKAPMPPPPPPTLPPPNMLNFGAPLAGGGVVGSPPSEGGSGSSESDEDDGGSPPPFGGGQPIQPVPMYANMGWPNSAAKMLP